MVYGCTTYTTPMSTLDRWGSDTVGRMNTELHWRLHMIWLYRPNMAPVLSSYRYHKISYRMLYAVCKVRHAFWLKPDLVYLAVMYHYLFKYVKSSIYSFWHWTCFTLPRSQTGMYCVHRSRQKASKIVKVLGPAPIKGVRWGRTCHDSLHSGVDRGWMDRPCEHLSG